MKCNNLSVAPSSIYSTVLFTNSNTAPVLLLHLYFCVGCLMENVLLFEFHIFNYPQYTLPRFPISIKCFCNLVSYMYKCTTWMSRHYLQMLQTWTFFPQSIGTANASNRRVRTGIIFWKGEGDVKNFFFFCVMSATGYACWHSNKFPCSEETEDKSPATRCNT